MNRLSGVKNTSSLPFVIGENGGFTLHSSQMHANSNTGISQSLVSKHLFQNSGDFFYAGDIEDIALNDNMQPKFSINKDKLLECLGYTPIILENNSDEK